MKTYYIVEHDDWHYGKKWQAYKRGIWSIFNRFNTINLVLSTISFKSPDECEAKLRKILNPTKPKVVRIIKI